MAASTGAAGASPEQSAADGTGDNGSGGGLSEAGWTVFRQRPGAASASARYADGDSRLSAGNRAAVRQWGQKNSADRRSGGAGSEGAGKAVSLRPACSDGVYGADGGRGFRHCVPAPCGFEPGGVRSAGPSAGGTGAEHFTIIGKKTKPGHDPPQGSHVPVFFSPECSRSLSY